MKDNIIFLQCKILQFEIESSKSIICKYSCITVLCFAIWNLLALKRFPSRATAALIQIQIAQVRRFITTITAAMYINIFIAAHNTPQQTETHI